MKNILSALLLVFLSSIFIVFFATAPSKGSPLFLLSLGIVSILFFALINVVWYRILLTKSVHIWFSRCLFWFILYFIFEVKDFLSLAFTDLVSFSDFGFSRLCICSCLNLVAIYCAYNFIHYFSSEKIKVQIKYFNISIVFVIALILILDFFGDSTHWAILALYPRFFSVFLGVFVFYDLYKQYLERREKKYLFTQIGWGVLGITICLHSGLLFPTYTYRLESIVVLQVGVCFEAILFSFYLVYNNAYQLAKVVADNKDTKNQDSSPSTQKPVAPDRSYSSQEFSIDWLLNLHKEIKKGKETPSNLCLLLNKKPDELDSIVYDKTGLALVVLILHIKRQKRNEGEYKDLFDRANRREKNGISKVRDYLEKLEEYKPDEKKLSELTLTEIAKKVLLEDKAGISRKVTKELGITVAKFIRVAEFVIKCKRDHTVWEDESWKSEIESIIASCKPEKVLPD